MTKPKVFISHISQEAELAEIFKKHLIEDFLGMVDVFVSSDNTSIALGSRWLDDIDTALKEAKIEVILCSHSSLERPWINFEAGAGWIRGIPVVPICHSGLQLSQLPVPLNLLQAVQANDIVGLHKLYTLVAKILESSTPNINLSSLASEVMTFEEQYQIMLSGSVLLQSQTTSLIGSPEATEDLLVEIESEPEAQIGLIEGHTAVRELLTVVGKIVDQINKSVDRVNDKSTRIKGLNRAQDRKLAIQIASDINNGSSKTEELLPELEANLKVVNGFFVTYTEWVTTRTQNIPNEVVKAHELISGILIGIKRAIERVHSTQMYMLDQKIISTDVGRASQRMAQTLNRVIAAWREVEQVCERSLQEIDKKLGTDEVLLQQPDVRADSDQIWEALADELIETFTSATSTDTPILSEYATSRSGIYEEHP